jgi:hypothetical protein
MLLAWVLGLVTYQLINPGAVGAWSTMWQNVAHWLGFTAQSWMSASVFSFVVAGAFAYLFDVVISRLRRGER